MTSPKIYTRTGDKGTTSLVNGERIPKSHIRLDAYGSVDELNAVIGLLVSHLSSHASHSDTRTFLQQIQNQLFNVGSQLACTDEQVAAKLPSVSAENIKALEVEMDKMSAKLAPLSEFILPGGHLLASHAHLARTVARRVERLCCKLAEEDRIPGELIPYLNRLNDYFFVLARYMNFSFSTAEVTWKK